MLSRIPTRCRQCGVKFTESEQGRRLHPECVDEWITNLLNKQAKKKEQERKKREAEGRREIRQRKEALKSISVLTEECRRIVQKIARIRDRHDGCISCHVGPNYGGRWNGSHFRPAGNNAAVELHLWNIHKACAQCNLFKGGNIGEYRPRLVSKIGVARVEWLESQTQVVKRTCEYLARFKQVMGKRLRRMEKESRE